MAAGSARGRPPHHPAASERLATRRAEMSLRTPKVVEFAVSNGEPHGRGWESEPRSLGQAEAYPTKSPACGPRKATGGGPNPRNRRNRRRSGHRYYAGICGRPPWMTAHSPSLAGRRSNLASNPRAASPCRPSCGTVRTASGSPVPVRPRSRLPRFASVLRHTHTTEGICGIPFARPRLDSSTLAGLRTRGAWLTVTG